jgi:hypothetical protein
MIDDNLLPELNLYIKSARSYEQGHTDAAHRPPTGFLVKMRNAILDAQDLSDLIKRYTHDGHLQTFEDRERFRTEARELLSSALTSGDRK